jgi:hypothetical protein
VPSRRSLKTVATRMAAASISQSRQMAGWHGKPTEIGFGSVRHVTLARARELAKDARGRLAEGINPKEARKPIEGATFGECADRLIAAMRPSWRNGKHAAQWETTLRTYAAPLRRCLPMR